MRRLTLVLMLVGLLAGMGQAGEPVPPREHAAFQSKALREAVYDRVRHRLWVLFPNGAVYAYADVPEQHFDGLLAAERPGTYFHHHIRNDYPMTRIVPGPPVLARRK